MLNFINMAAIAQCLLLAFYFSANRKKYAGSIYQAILLLVISGAIWIGGLYANKDILYYPQFARFGFFFSRLIGSILYIARGQLSINRIG